MGENGFKKQSKKPLVIVCLCLLAVVAGVAHSVHDLFTHSNTVMRLLPGIDITERQAQLQEQLDESMIAFSINTSPVFATGGSEGNLMLENPEHNAKLLVAEIYLDDTQELIYQSKAIPAGAYIENAMLDKVLEPGEYQATAYFKAYREDDRSFIGQAGAAIKITVLS